MHFQHVLLQHGLSWAHQPEARNSWPCCCDDRPSCRRTAVLKCRAFHIQRDAVAMMWRPVWVVSWNILKWHLKVAASSFSMTISEYMVSLLIVTLSVLRYVLCVCWGKPQNTHLDKQNTRHRHPIGGFGGQGQLFFPRSSENYRHQDTPRKTDREPETPRKTCLGTSKDT